MKIIENNTTTLLQDIIKPYYDHNKVLFFDIETTGFVAKQSQLYLIGCCYFKNNQLNTIQWFNDDGNSEKEILEAFSKFIIDYSYLLSFNGEGFDIPYLTSKMDSFKLANCFDAIESVDLYKLLRGMKNTLHLDNMKQKSIESFLGIKRDDQYNGGELIKVYKDYLKSSSASYEKLLLLHNYEDLCGMPELFKMLSYVALKDGIFYMNHLEVNNGKLEIYLDIPNSLPKRLNISSNHIQISGYHNEVIVRIPILHEEMKFFYNNYKEYYYLPYEDTAIHKSVASYVDKNYRIQATKENCYVKKQGYYITQLNADFMPGYKKNASDKETFIPLVDSFFQNKELLNEYIQFIIKVIL